MNKNFRPIWLRIGYRAAPRFWDALCVLADRGGKGLRRFLSRFVDLDDLRPRQSRRKPSYLPDLQKLEDRMVPTLTVLGCAGGYPTVGETWPAPAIIPPNGVLATVSDPNGYQGAAAYAATVDWGDGTSGPGGMVNGTGGGGFVLGEHIYEDAGTYTMTVSVTGHSDSGSGTSSVIVTVPTPLAIALPPNASQVGTLPFGSTISYSVLTGAVILGVPLNSTGGSTCGCTNPALYANYNGGSVGQPTIQINLGTSAGGTVPSSVTDVLTWGGTAEATITYGTSGISAGDVLVMDIQPTVAVTASGAYAWSVAVTPAGGTTTILTGTAYIDVTSASEGVTAGNGWTLAGISRLISTTGGLEWKDGQGNGQFFAGSLGAYTSPAGNFGTLTKNMDGSYTYAAKGGLYTDYFNSSGYQTGKATADGQLTTMTYSGSELTGVATPDGRFVTMGYDGSGNLQTVQMPGGTATMVHDGSGNLTSIQRPDSSYITFAYDANGRLTVKQTPDTTITAVYDGHGMLESLDGGLGVTETIVPSLAHGFGANASNLQNADLVVTDALSRTTTIMLDPAGQPAQIEAPDGSLKKFTYDDNFDQTTMVDPLGRFTNETYDNYGDPTSITTPDGATTTMQYDATLHEVTSIKNPLGNLQTMTYSGTGDLQTATDGTGAKTTYVWSGGLLQSVTNPLNLATSYAYDTHNDLIAIIAPTGLRTTLAYDTAGNQVSVEQPDGTFVTTVYDTMGRPTGTVNPDGSRITTTYNGDGNIVTQSDVRGNLTTQVYDAAGRDIAVIDPLGNRVTTVYDAADEVIARVDMYGNRNTFVYDDNGRLQATEDQYGHFTTTVFDLAGEAIATVDPYGSRASATYDAAGRPVGTLDTFGNRTTSVYDAAGELIASVDQYANRTSFVYDAAGREIAVEDHYGHYVTTVFDAAGDVTAQVDNLGNRTSSIYDTYGRQVATEDPYGHFTTTVFDAYGRVSANVDVLGNAVTTLYDTYGRPQATVDALGNRATTSYDSYGEPVATQTSLGFATTVYDTYGRISAEIDQLGNITTTIYDSYGRAAATVDALGNRTTAIFDTYGRPSATEDARGNFVTTVYDSYGREQATVDGLGDRTTTVYDSYGREAATEDARGNYVSTIYDSLGRAAATEDQLGNFTTTIFDSYGRAAATEDGRGNYVTIVYDSYGRQAATEDSRGNFVTTVFDSYGRVAATENSLGNFTTTIYDSYGRPSASVDPLGNRTTTVFDAYGRQVATIDPLGNRTTMVLDSLGRQVNEIDSNLNKTTFVYDDLGHVVQELTPTGGSITMAYDADGRLSSETDALGRRIDYGFDADGNNTGQTWHNADGSTSYLTFTYDDNGRQLTAANSVGTYTMTLDATGEVSTVHGLWGAVLTFTYDAAGHRTVVQDNFGGVATNAYDANGNLTQQKFGGTGLTPMRIDQAYDPNNELTDVARYSDLAGTTKVATTSHVYDAAGELTSQIDKTGGGTSIANYTNIYDAAGRITSEKLNGGAPTTYAYDADGQLTGDGTTTPTYDAEGNRTNTPDSTGAGNELQSDATWDYTYDQAGNETMKVAISGGEAWTYGYDNKNELLQAKLWTDNPVVYGTSGDPVLKEVDYKYDVWGNMTERDDYPTGSGSPTVTRFAVDGWNPALAGATGTSNFNVWGDLDGSNNLQTRYLHGDQLDQLIARQDAGVQYWYLTDRQGSVRDVLDNSGNVKDAIVYDGFGNIISETNSAYRGGYAWTGRQFDVETDLQYNRARWYDPATARWQSQDPLGFDAGDSNLYRYVHNSPTAEADPSGLFFAGLLTIPRQFHVTSTLADATLDVVTQNITDGYVLLELKNQHSLFQTNGITSSSTNIPSPPTRYFVYEISVANGQVVYKPISPRARFEMEIDVTLTVHASSLLGRWTPAVDIAKADLTAKYLPARDIKRADLVNWDKSSNSAFRNTAVPPGWNLAGLPVHATFSRLEVYRPGLLCGSMYIPRFDAVFFAFAADRISGGGSEWNLGDLKEF